MTGRLVAVAVAVAVVVTGCGDGGLPEPLSQDLQQRVAEVRQAAVAQDRAAARQGLAEIRAIVEEARADGRISAEKADDILAAAEQVEVNLALLPEPPPPPPPPPSPTDEDDDRAAEDRGEDRGEGKDRGKDRGKDQDEGEKKGEKKDEDEDD